MAKVQSSSTTKLSVIQSFNFLFFIFSCLSCFSWFEIVRDSPCQSVLFPVIEKSPKIRSPAVKVVSAFRSLPLNQSAEESSEVIFSEFLIRSYRRILLFPDMLEKLTYIGLAGFYREAQ